MDLSANGSMNGVKVTVQNAAGAVGIVNLTTTLGDIVAPQITFVNIGAGATPTGSVSLDAGGSIGKDTIASATALNVSLSAGDGLDASLPATVAAYSVQVNPGSTKTINIPGVTGVPSATVKNGELYIGGSDTDAQPVTFGTTRGANVVLDSTTPTDFKGTSVGPLSVAVL